MSSTQTVVASFPSPEGAKSAVAALERRGVPPADVRLVGQEAAPSRDVAASDTRALDWLAGVAGRGAAVGALVGAALLLVVIAVAKEADPDVTWLLGSLGGAVGGALVGAMVAVGLRAPRHPQAWSVHGAEPGAETRLAITVRSVPPAELVSLLEQAGATSVEPDGA
jgi:hypothetical protein